MIRWWLLLFTVALSVACETPAAQDADVVNSTNQAAASNPSRNPDGVGTDVKPGKTVRLCQIKSGSVRESSGIAITNPKMESFWTHNDSGDNSELYLISTSTGELMSTVELGGAKNDDWEDMAHFEYYGKPWLLIADVGDNQLKRKKYRLYLFDASGVDSQKKQKIDKQLVHELEFDYEDGPHDCEAVAVVGNGKSVLLIEKRMNPFTSPPTGVYQLDLPEGFSGSDKLTAKRIAGITAWAVTGMDLSPDQSSLVLRSYTGAQLYRKQYDRQSWAELLQKDDPQFVSLPVQQQGEAICFTPDGKRIWITSEGKETFVWQVDLPAN